MSGESQSDQAVPREELSVLTTATKGVVKQSFLICIANYVSIRSDWSSMTQIARREKHESSRSAITSHKNTYLHESLKCRFLKSSQTVAFSIASFTSGWHIFTGRRETEPEGGVRSPDTCIILNQAAQLHKARNEGRDVDYPGSIFEIEQYAAVSNVHPLPGKAILDARRKLPEGWLSPGGQFTDLLEFLAFSVRLGLESWDVNLLIPLPSRE